MKKKSILRRYTLHPAVVNLLPLLLIEVHNTLNKCQNVENGMTNKVVSYFFVYKITSRSLLHILCTRKEINNNGSKLNITGWAVYISPSKTFFSLILVFYYS